MGCFWGCFGGRKNRRRQRRRESDQARENKLSVESAKPVHVNDRVPTGIEIPKTSEICNEAEVKCSPSPTKKRVTFDSNVKTYEHIVSDESVELLEEKKEEVKSKKLTKTDKAFAQILEAAEAAENTSGPYPSNHRYENCIESDDDIEEDASDYSESDLDEDKDEEYYSDVGFSEDNLHNPTKEVYTKETGDKPEENDTKLRRSNSDGAQGVLNPVENLTQWQFNKSKGRTMQKQSEKENSGLISDNQEKSDSSYFSIDPQTEPKKLRNQEVAVDASLSTWLSTSETGSDCNSVSMHTSTPDKHKSTCSSKPAKFNHEDRPILCALTLEDIKHFSASSTPRRSPSKSPDDTPIIGTVGGYWSHRSKAMDCGSASSFKGIPNTTSKYREDKSVNWHSTPFETRLEKAMNRDK